MVAVCKLQPCTTTSHKLAGAGFNSDKFKFACFALTIVTTASLNTGTRSLGIELTLALVVLVDLI